VDGQLRHLQDPLLVDRSFPSTGQGSLALVSTQELTHARTGGNRACVRAVTEILESAAPPPVLKEQTPAHSMKGECLPCAGGRQLHELTQ
jgi:hypothetical protein